MPLQPARRQLRLNLCAQLLAPLLATTWSGSMRAPLSGLLQQLATDATLTRRPAGELLYTSGCKSDELLFLIRGAVDVYVPPQEQNEPPSISGGRQARKCCLTYNEQLLLRTVEDLFVRRAPQRPPRFACPGVPRALCPS